MTILLTELCARLPRVLELYDKNGSILDDILEFGFGSENFDENEDNYIGIL